MIRLGFLKWVVSLITSVFASQKPVIYAGYPTSHIFPEKNMRKLLGNSPEDILFKELIDLSFEKDGITYFPKHHKNKIYWRIISEVTSESFLFKWLLCHYPATVVQEMYQGNTICMLRALISNYDLHVLIMNKTGSKKMDTKHYPITYIDPKHYIENRKKLK